jgi:ABC-type nitrate/sulfonate/bicarbonate transport system permease component
MTSSPEMPPRRSVPAPQLTWAQRLREVVLSSNAIRTASVAVFFVIWEYYGRRMDPIFMAPPSAIFQAALELIRTGALEKALVQTLWPFAVGMALTVVIGVALGIVMAQWRTLEYVLDPFVNALYAIPRIALIPLIILWAGLEFAGKVTILVSVAVFPITVNTYSGIRDVRGGCWRSAAPMAPLNGRFFGRSFCRRRSPSSWRASAWRSAWRSSASSLPSSSPPSAGSAA